MNAELADGSCLTEAVLAAPNKTGAEFVEPKLDVWLLLLLLVEDEPKPNFGGSAAGCVDPPKTEPNLGASLVKLAVVSLDEAFCVLDMKPKVAGFV